MSTPRPRGNRRPRPHNNRRNVSPRPGSALLPIYLARRQPALGINVARFRAIHESAVRQREREEFERGMTELLYLEYGTNEYSTTSTG